MIDSVLDEYNYIKSRIEKIEEQQKRFIKYFAIQDRRCIDIILKMNNIVYSFFDKIVDSYNLDNKQIHDLIYNIYYWEARADAVLSEYKFYILIQYFYIANHNDFKDNEEFSKWNDNKELFSKRHKYRIEFCMNKNDYHIYCDAFLAHLRSKYFIYIRNNYQQLCQTTKY